MSWHDIVTGRGLQRVPAPIRHKLVCCECSDGAPVRMLWTDQRVTSNGTTKDYRRMFDNLADKCYCRVHAEYRWAEY
jgi:hypothetical protein